MSNYTSILIVSQIPVEGKLTPSLAKTLRVACRRQDSANTATGEGHRRSSSQASLRNRNLDFGRCHSACYESEAIATITNSALKASVVSGTATMHTYFFGLSFVNSYVTLN
jgi:2-methylaconitate cis-trans-isomerase PrpF